MKKKPAVWPYHWLKSDDHVALMPAPLGQDSYFYFPQIIKEHNPVMKKRLRIRDLIFHVTRTLAIS